MLITYKNEEIANQISDLEDQISDLKKKKIKVVSLKIMKFKITQMS
ncbi:hypothetical protein QJS64_02245 [Paraclostridium bifermentans]|uniref:Uncharacterized protein n=1 Tax=Paraclostridium bifermentans TaxID=1490 RepID=A0ABY8R438_PARBF|nr:hypothetical protein QJS64_02245 [Paraclostridium bifermentans]